MMPADKTRPIKPAPAKMDQGDAASLPKDTQPPVFDVTEQDLRWSHDDVVIIDDDGNVMPADDPLDDGDPYENGETRLDDIADMVPDLPVGAETDPPAKRRPPGAR